MEVPPEVEKIVTSCNPPTREEVDIVVKWVKTEPHESVRNKIVQEWAIKHGELILQYIDERKRYASGQSNAVRDQAEDIQSS
jgi:hypothetical protein